MRPVFRASDGAGVGNRAGPVLPLVLALDVGLVGAAVMVESRV